MPKCLKKFKENNQQLKVLDKRLFFRKNIPIINKTHIRARKICIFHLFILILQPILDLIWVFFLLKS